MKYRLDPLVKEQMKYLPEQGAGKVMGNTARNKEWIPQVQKASLEEEVCYHPNGNYDPISNNPRRDTENAFVDYAVANPDYNGMSREDFNTGFRIEDLDGLTNEYTGQHCTIFYDSVTREDKETGKSVTGFLERGNFLDRL
jgi:hypothetical protein